MRYGFTLLEVLVGTFIATILAGTLLYVLAQIESLQVVIDRRITVWTSVSIFQHQLERDIEGIFVPAEKFEEKKNKNKKELDKKKELIFLEDICYVKKGVAGIEQFSCITTTVLSSYKNQKNRAVRVVYTLIPDKDNPDSFSLVRQEGNVFELKKYTEKDSIFSKTVIVNSIAAWDMHFIVLQANQNKKEIIFDVYKEWPPPVKQDEKNEQKKILIPDFVEVILTVWSDSIKKKQETISWYIPVISTSDAVASSIEDVPENTVKKEKGI